MPSTKSSSILRHQQQLAMRSIKSSATPQSAPVRRFFGFAIQRCGYFEMSTNAFIACLCLLWPKFTLSRNDRPFASRSPLVTTSETKLKLLLWIFCPEVSHSRRTLLLLPTSNDVGCYCCCCLIDHLWTKEINRFIIHALQLVLILRYFDISSCELSKPKTALVLHFHCNHSSYTVIAQILACLSGNWNSSAPCEDCLSTLSRLRLPRDCMSTSASLFQIHACPEIDQVSRLSLNLPLNLSCATRFEHIS